MTKYDIEVKGVEDGLAQPAVLSMVRDAFPDAEAVTVTESEE